MKHIITATDVPGDGYTLEVGDLVEFTDSCNNKHNMVVIPECICKECCLGNQLVKDSNMRVCSVLNGQYSICYSGKNRIVVHKFVSFAYIDNILEDL